MSTPGERIYKYPLAVTDRQELTMPEGAEILTVQTQGGEPMLWARVNRAAPSSVRTFITHGTGHAVDDEAYRYVGTYQLHGGELVFHVFEASHP